MDQLRIRLKSCSEVLTSRDVEPCASLEQSRLVAITANTLLALAASGEIFCIDIRPHNTSIPTPLRLSRPLPQSSHSLLLSPCRQFLLAYSERTLNIVHLNDVRSLLLQERLPESSPNKQLQVTPLAQSLFQDYPLLKVLDVSFHPHAEGHVAVLTSDSKLYLIDVYSPNREASFLQFDIRTTASPPVSFTFDHPHGWGYFSVYLLAEDGLIYVLNPVAPLGSKIPKKTWQLLRNHAEKGWKGYEDGSSDDYNEDDLENRQPSLKLNFLNTFAASKDGKMIKVRPGDIGRDLLCQGPMSVNAGKDGEEEESVVTEATYDLIRALPHEGMIPVFLCTNKRGQGELIIAEEMSMPAWFDHTSYPYEVAAENAAVPLLCYESLVFPHRTSSMVVSLSQDAFYIANGSSVLSLHVPWIRYLTQTEPSNDGLGSLPTSSLRVILSTNVDDTVGQAVIGIAGAYFNKVPLAVVLTNTFALFPSQHISFALKIPPALPGLPKVESGEESAGRNEIVPSVLPETQVATFPVEGLLKTLRGDDESVARLVEYLSNRLNLFKETTVPALTAISKNIEKNIEILGKNLDGQQARLDDFEKYKAIIEESALPVRNKLRRAVALDSNLRERIAVLRKLTTSITPLSAQERERYKWLQERLRKSAALKRSLEGLREAIHHATRAKSTITPQRVSESPRREPLPRTPRRGLYSSPFRARSASRGSLQGGASPGQAIQNSRKSSPCVAHSEPYDVSQRELEDITQALALHAKEINSATALAGSLWKALST